MAAEARGRFAVMPVETEGVLEELVDQWGEILGANHPTVASMLYDLATFLQAQGRLGQAEEALRRAVGILDSSRPVDDSGVAAMLESYADVLARLDRDGEARVVRARAAAIRDARARGRTFGDR